MQLSESEREYRVLSELGDEQENKVGEGLFIYLFAIFCVGTGL